MGFRSIKVPKELLSLDTLMPFKKGGKWRRLSPNK